MTFYSSFIFPIFCQFNFIILYNWTTDGIVSELKNKIESLEDLLRISRHTVETLQQKLSDLEASYLEKLAEQNVELRDLERILKEQQGAADSGSLSRQEMIMKLERMQEIAKTEQKLVGAKVWTPTFGDFKVYNLFVILSPIFW